MARANESERTSERTFEVTNSFDGLNLGERFSAANDDWAKARVESGYLRDVTDEGEAGAAQGQQAAVASDEQVQGARGASEVGKG